MKPTLAVAAVKLKTVVPPLVFRIPPEKKNGPQARSATAPLLTLNVAAPVSSPAAMAQDAVPAPTAESMARVGAAEIDGGLSTGVLTKGDAGGVQLRQR